VISYALRKIGVLPMGSTASADESANALIELELMLKQWAFDGPFLYTKRESSQTLVANTAAYTLSSSLPLRIIEARYRDTSSPVNDLPMQPLTRDEYFNLPNKTATGTPTTYYFDPVATGGILYVWPLLASATTESVRYTYQRRIEDIDALTNHLDIPQEWLGTVGYCLADRLLDDYGVSDKVGDRITARAGEMLQKAKDFEREEFYFFRPGFYRY
jgi:hypothetical protein